MKVKTAVINIRLTFIFDFLCLLCDILTIYNGIDNSKLKVLFYVKIVTIISNMFFPLFFSSSICVNQKKFDEYYVFYYCYILTRILTKCIFVIILFMKNLDNSITFKEIKYTTFMYDIGFVMIGTFSLLILVICLMFCIFVKSLYHLFTFIPDETIEEDEEDEDTQIDDLLKNIAVLKDTINRQKNE